MKKRLKVVRGRSILNDISKNKVKSKHKPKSKLKSKPKLNKKIAVKLSKVKPSKNKLSKNKLSKVKFSKTKAPKSSKPISKHSKSVAKASKPVKASSIDMSKIKQDIEQELKKGNVKISGADSARAQILEQRQVIDNEVKNLSKKVKGKKGKLDSNKNGSKKSEHIGRLPEYIKTGIPGFDDLFEHGIPKGNAVIVAGGAGSGKTILCLQTIFHHISNGRKCFYMSFEESEEKLIQHMNDFGWDVMPYIKSGKLVIKRLSPFEISRSVEAMLAKEKGELLIEVDPILIPKGFKPDIIALDSLTAIASALSVKEQDTLIKQSSMFVDKVVYLDK